MLKILRRIIQEIKAADRFDIALQVMAQRVRETLDSQICLIYLFNHPQSEYVLCGQAGFDSEQVGVLKVGLNQGLVGYVAAREEAVNIEDVTSHEKYQSDINHPLNLYKAFLGVPIISHRQMLGVLIIQDQEARQYDEAEEAFLSTMATQFASVIAHAGSAGALAELFGIPNTQREATYVGIPSAPGVAIGIAKLVYLPADLEGVPDKMTDNIDLEINRFELALQAAREDIHRLKERLAPNLPEEEQALFEVYLRVLDGSGLGKEVINVIREGHWAEGALRQVIQKHIRQFEQMQSAYLRERATDIKDLARRILTYLQSNKITDVSYTEHTVLIGEEITATHLAEVPEGYLAGVVSAKGSNSSHVAILARAMGVPTVMGVSDIYLQRVDNEKVIVDGYYGQVYISPSVALLTEFQRLVEEEKALAKNIEILDGQVTQTKEGRRITLLVNAGLGSDMSSALSAGAEGVGLYRTEIPFMIRDRFPSSEEQRVIYRQLLAAFSPRPVTMRTLDIGGDKPLSYFPFEEDNPFLGWRGIRIALDQPEIFLTQVRAMLRASVGYDNLRIMFPMISDVSEVDEALRLLQKAHQEILEEGVHVSMPQIGVMVEVPSAVYQARGLAKRVDFLSVGSNDLTQYLLAVDRNNARVANLYDTLHPAVLRALMQVVDSGHSEGKHVSICGEIAGDPVAVALLLAMGFDSLSMSASSLARIKWVISHFTKQRVHELLQEVLMMESAVTIRCHLESALEQLGLGVLIRAGR